MRIIGVLILLLTHVGFVNAAVPAGTRFVMSHFKSDGGGGDERLYISVSPDGLTWTSMNGGNPVWQPPAAEPFFNVVRDPTIIFANGFWWVAYTSGNYGRHPSFGLVKSADLENWTFVINVPTPIPNATDTFTWNPTFFRDGDGSIHVFVSISPDGGGGYNPEQKMRSYETHPLDASFQTWSTPVLIPLPTTKCNELWVWKEGSIYHGIYVDFANASAQVHVTSNNLLTGWSNAQAFGQNGFEGAMVLKKPSGGYRVYCEAGNVGDPLATYRFKDTTDFITFSSPQSVTSQVPMRNGKMTAINPIRNYGEWSTQKLGALPEAEREPSADSDKDGVANIAEFACGGDPMTGEAMLFQKTVISKNDQDFLGLIFQRSPESNVTMVAEELDSMSDGVPVLAIVESVTLMSDGAEQMHIRQSLPLGSETKKFLRLSVSLP